MSAQVDAIVKGFGPNFPGLDALFALKPTQEQLATLSSPIPALGRYSSSVEFMSQVTSQRQVSLLRFKVMIEYFIFLNREIGGSENYQKNPLFKKLTDSQIQQLRKLATNDSAIIQAEYIEHFTDHDTAAAGDYLKLLISRELPELISQIEGIHFAATSEDVMGNVFGLIGNDLVYKHFSPALLSFCQTLIAYVEKHEIEYPLILPASTHQQPAELTTLGMKFATRLQAINTAIDSLYSKEGGLQRFSGKLGGAVGNLTTHDAAFPEIDWETLLGLFVGDLGLHYEVLTDQSVSYVVEARILNAVTNILEQVIKLVRDFVDMAGAPAQFFVKQKKPGAKGSSIMPNKSNAWAMEGAIAMLEKAQNAITFTAKKLQQYPAEGNMARSFLFRDVGSDFMPIFIAFSRITKELNQYVPNHANISMFIDRYPGMSGSIIQTILKREGIEGDAYRVIQSISINPDGSYANTQQFKAGLAQAMIDLNLSSSVQDEILTFMFPVAQVNKADVMARISLMRMRDVTFPCVLRDSQEI